MFFTVWKADTDKQEIRISTASSRSTAIPSRNQLCAKSVKFANFSHFRHQSPAKLLPIKVVEKATFNTFDKIKGANRSGVVATCTGTVAHSVAYLLLSLSRVATVKIMMRPSDPRFSALDRSSADQDSSIRSNLVIDGTFVSDRLSAMRRQEVASYRCADYFRHLHVGQPFHAPSSSTKSNEIDQGSQIEQRREKVCEWIFQVVDQCDMDREIAEVAMSFLDRFLASILIDQQHEATANALNDRVRSLSPYPSQQQQPINKRQKLQKADYETSSPGSVAYSDDDYSSYSAKSSGGSVSTSTSASVAATIAIGGFAFQLASLTALYLAIKLYDHRRIRIDRLAHLSRGNFSTDDIVSMEGMMLSALRWKCNAPTSIDFLRTFYALFPTTSPSSSHVNDDIMELARFFVELSVWECTFVPQESSTIALAAILNAMDMVGDTRFPAASRNVFLKNIEVCAPGVFDLRGQQLAFVRLRLAEIFEQSAECTPDGVHEKFLSSLSVNQITGSKDAREAVPSPVCISQIST